MRKLALVLAVMLCPTASAAQTASGCQPDSTGDSCPESRSAAAAAAMPTHVRPTKSAPTDRRVVPDMTPDLVRAAWGDPRCILRTQTSENVMEEWYYAPDKQSKAEQPGGQVRTAKVRLVTFMDGRVVRAVREEPACADWPPLQVGSPAPPQPETPR